jgi:hypothetical protein
MWHLKFLPAIVAFALGLALLTPSPAKGTVQAVIVQNGFVPEWVDLNETSSDVLNGYAYSDVTNAEIPLEGVTFSWSLSYASFYDFYTDTWYDLQLGENWTYYYDEDCYINIVNFDQQNCTLQATLYAEGYIYIEVKLTVDYPDGY